MISRTVPAGVHVVSILAQKGPFRSYSKLLPLVQLVVRLDTILQHRSLERALTVFPYRGMENDVVIIITGVFQMLPPAVF